MKKSKTTALVLSILVGGLGIDRFYLGYTGMGILKLLTAGCFGILYIIDIINIATGNLTPADGGAYEEDITFRSSNTENNNSNLFDDLERISNLHKEGALNDDEFTRIKSELLKRI